MDATARRRHAFLLEPRHRRVIGREVMRQDLDGNVASEPGIARPMHLPHAAAAEAGKDFVGTEAGAGC